jgi:hypothetical protein
MARVICDVSASLDGYVTGPNDSRENPFGDGADMLHDWMFDAATDDDGPSCRRCSTASARS